MVYEKPHIDVIIFKKDDLPYTDLIDASGSGPDYEYGVQPIDC